MTLVGEVQARKYATRELPVCKAVAHLARDRGMAVQAGGSLGIFPNRLATLFRQVVTCEADPLNFAVLQREVVVPNVTRIHAALGDRPGLVGVSRHRRDGKSHDHPGICHVSGEGTVPMLRIDDLPLTGCDAILLDVEGYELYVLRGAVETIKKFRPVIAAEVNKSLLFYGLTEAEVLGFFETHRYVQVATYGSDRVFVPAERSC